MKKTLILFLFMMLFIINTFSFDIQASTTNNGVVSLNEDGSWKWLIQPAEFSGFNNDESDPNPASTVETVLFDFAKFSSFPVDYVGKWTWITGEIYTLSEEEEGYTLRLKTPKNTSSWIQEYGDLFIVQYDGIELKPSQNIELLVKYKGLGYKYYSNVPVFTFEDQSEIKILD